MLNIYNEEDLHPNAELLLKKMKNYKFADKIDYRKLRVSPHAAMRASERLDLHSKKEARDFVKNYLRKAVKIGVVMSFNGELNVLFAHNQVQIFLSPCLKHVVSVYTQEKITYEPIKNLIPELSKTHNDIELKQKLIDLHMRELKHIKDREQRKIISLTKTEKEMTREIAALKKRLKNFKTFKDAVKTTSQIQRVTNDGKNYIAKLSSSIFFDKIRTRHVARSLSAIV